MAETIEFNPMNNVTGTFSMWDVLLEIVEIGGTHRSGVVIGKHDMAQVECTGGGT